VIRARGEDGRYCGLRCAMADQSRICSRARCKTQCIQNDGFASSRLAGKRSQARANGQVQGLYQNDISDPKTDQHGVKIAWNRLH